MEYDEKEYNGKTAEGKKWRIEQLNDGYRLYIEGEEKAEYPYKLFELTDVQFIAENWDY